MKRILSYLSRPPIFALVMTMLLGLAAATWSIDAYLDWRSADAEQLERAQTLSTAARIVERGNLVVGIRNNVAPFGYLDDDGNLVGFDVDIAQEFARRWLKSDESLEIVVVNAADRIPLLVSKEIDLLIAAMPNRRDRDALIDFSQTYFEDRLGLLVRSNSDIDSLSDLQRRQIGVLSGSNASETLSRESLRQDMALRLQEFADYPQALNALGEGAIDAIAANSVALVQMAQGNPGLQVVNTPLNRQPYSVGVPEGESLIRSMVNFTLEDMKHDGTYDRIYEKWFIATSPLEFGRSPGEWSFDLSSLPEQSSQVELNPLNAIRERGYIVAGIPNEVEPFGFRDSNNQWTGFDVEFVRELARRWLGDETAIQLVPGEIYDHVSRLSAGEIDLVAAGMIMRREWAHSIDFSQSYLGPPVVNEPLGVAVPQHASKFRELLNFTLQEMKKDGVYDALHIRWFGPDLPIYEVETWPGDADYLLASYYDQETPVRITAKRESTIKRIRQRGNILRVGIADDAYPFGYLNENAVADGFDVDLARAIAAEWGVDIAFVSQDRSEQVAQLLQGEVDLVGAGMVHTKQREAEIDFSQTYFVNGLSILTRQALIEQSQEVQVDELNDTPLSVLLSRRIAVVGNLATSAQSQAHLDANGIIAELIVLDTLDAAIELLQSNNVDAIIADNIRLGELAQDSPELGLLEDPFTKDPYALGLTPGDSYFQNLLNDTIQQLKKDGTYDSIHQKWFGQDLEPLAIEILPAAWPYTFQNSPTTLAKPESSVIDRLGTFVKSQQRFQSQTDGQSVEQETSRTEDEAAQRLVVGIKADARPFSFLKEDGTAAGLGVELARSLASRWLGNPAAVDFVEVTDEAMGQLLADGSIDLVIGEFSHDEERHETIDFSQTYFQSALGLLLPESLLASADSGSQESTIDDLLARLDQRTVAVIEDGTSIGFLQKLANQYRISLNILSFRSEDSALEALNNGLADGVAGAPAILEGYVAQFPRLILVDELLDKEPYALGLPPFDERFRDLVNFTLQEMQADGTIQRLISTWIGEGQSSVVEIWPGDSYIEHDLVPMSYIPPGEFMRGNASGFPDERIERIVSLDGYYMDQYEVTNRQYDRCVQAGFCNTPRLPRSINFSRYFAQSAFGNYPVLWVSWYDAAEYCDFVGKRLPTEAEWERAARGPSNDVYPWGNAIPVDQSNFDYVRRDVAPVGSFPEDRSAYGVYDLAGNVREWVSDWYEWSYYQEAQEHSPMGPDSGVTKVLRGGSWNDTAVYVRGTVRRNFLPESVDANLGFRCASSKPPLAR